MEIPIANIYYLLCYAWEALEEKDAVTEVNNQDSTQLLDLFARVLLSGTRRLIRRGLDRGYLSQEDEFSGIRGKLLITQTVRRDLIRHARAACVWDELEYSTLPNRILKATFKNLYKEADLAPQTRSDVRDALRWLAPVQGLDLRAEYFRRVQLHCNNRSYSFLLHVCEFIYEHWLPDEKGGRCHFRDFIREGLPDLFEDFVFNFYEHHKPLNWKVTAPIIHWQKFDWNNEANELLPRMETDVCLQGPRRAIILDTKFYAQALKSGAYGSPKLSSPNLYQIYTYLRQRSCEPGWEQAEGILLYPRTTRDFTVEFTTHGHRIRALTLDLTQPWHKIHAALMQIITGSQMPGCASRATHS